MTAVVLRIQQQRHQEQQQSLPKSSREDDVVRPHCCLFGCCRRGKAKKSNFRLLGQIFLLAAVLLLSPTAAAAASSTGTSLLVSSSSTTTTSAPSVPAPRAPATVIETDHDDNTAEGGSSERKQNPIVGIAVYLKDSMVRTVQGCGQLYTNHKACQSIRGKQTVYRNQIQQEWAQKGLYPEETSKEIQKRLKSIQGGITYDDFRFLQKGKEDRGKVLNLVFLVWGAPRILPYALMFNPDMLPSPFQMEQKQTEDVLQKLSRDSSQAMLTLLMNIERQALEVASKGGFLSGMLGGKSEKKQRNQQVLNSIVDQVPSFLSPSPSSSLLLEQLPLYQTGEPFTRAQNRLCTVPSVLVQGLNRVVQGQAVPGVISSLTPAFFVRNKLVAHITKIANADDFLIQAQIDLQSIPRIQLQEACRERLLDPYQPNDVLRQSLQEWLDLTVVQPSLKVREGATTRRSSTDEDTTAPPPTIYYNGNLARMALMGYNGCQTIRSGPYTPRLPQEVLLNFSSESNSSNRRIQATSSNGGATTKKKKGLFGGGRKD